MENLKCESEQSPVKPIDTIEAKLYRLFGLSIFCFDESRAISKKFFGVDPCCECAVITKSEPCIDTTINAITEILQRSKEILIEFNSSL